MVPAGGIGIFMTIENKQVIDFSRRQNLNPDFPYDIVETTLHQHQYASGVRITSARLSRKS